MGLGHAPIRRTIRIDLVHCSVYPGAVATTVNIHEAKTHLSKLLVRVQAGEEIIIANAGKPVAKLMPIQEKPKKREVGFDKGKIWIADDFTAPLPNDLLDEFYK